MTLAITLKITPPTQVFSAIVEELRKDQKAETAKSKSRTRRTAYQVVIGGTGKEMNIIFFEQKPKPKARRGPPASAKNFFKKSTPEKPSISITANLADILIGRHALSSECLVIKSGELQLDLCKKALNLLFPYLDDGIVESITADHCQLQSIRFGMYFKFFNETKASKALFDLDRQAKITRGNLFDFSSKSAKVDLGVVPDESSHHGITISLPFGRAHASVRRLFNETSVTYSKPVSQQHLDAAIRCLLCIEVDVDLQKFAVGKSNGLTFKFPRDYQLWTVSNLPENPVEIIWNSVLRALRLDVPLASNESDVNFEGLDWMQRKIVEAYLAGRYLGALEEMPKDGKEILAMREMLASTASVDIFIPWVIAKLNLSKTLGPKLAPKSRFNPGADEVLEQCTLSNKNFDDAKTKLAKKMDSNAWIIRRPK